jgi:hypothetical protein
MATTTVMEIGIAGMIVDTGTTTTDTETQDVVETIVARI